MILPLTDLPQVFFSMEGRRFTWVAQVVNNFPFYNQLHPGN